MTIQSIHTTLEALGRDVISWGVPLFQVAFPHSMTNIITTQGAKCYENPEQYLEQSEKIIEAAKAIIGIAVLTTFFLGNVTKAGFVAAVGGLGVVGYRDFIAVVQRFAAEGGAGPLNNSIASLAESNNAFSNMWGSNEISHTLNTSMTSQVDVDVNEQ